MAAEGLLDEGDSTLNGIVVKRTTLSKPGQHGGVFHFREAGTEMGETTDRIFANVDMPRVQFRDNVALSKLPCRAIDGYLRATGWESYGGSESSLVGVYRHCSGLGSVTVLRDDSATGTDRIHRIALMMTTLAHVEQRSELEIYWHILDWDAGAGKGQARSAVVIDGEALMDIYAYFMVEMDGLKECPDCEGQDNCDDCGDCAGFDCEELRRVDALMVYIGPQVHVKAPLQRSA